MAVNRHTALALIWISYVHILLYTPQSWDEYKNPKMVKRVITTVGMSYLFHLLMQKTYCIVEIEQELKLIVCRWHHQLPATVTECTHNTEIVCPAHPPPPHHHHKKSVIHQMLWRVILAWRATYPPQCISRSRGLGRKGHYDTARFSQFYLDREKWKLKIAVRQPFWIRIWLFLRDPSTQKKVKKKKIHYFWNFFFFW